MHMRKEENRKPSILEGREILNEVVDIFGLKFVAYYFSVAIKTVAEWLERTNNPIVRTRNLLREIVNEGHEHLALKILRYLTNSIGYFPVKEQAPEINFNTILDAILLSNKENAEVQCACSDMLDGLVAETEKIEQAIKEVDDTIQASVQLKKQLKDLLDKAKTNGGKVVLTLNQSSKKVVAHR